MNAPALSDGSPLAGDLIAVLDESSPANKSGGVAYVVTAGAIFDLNAVRLTLDGFFPQVRTRPFHWAKEGVEARTRMLELATHVGVVAVAYYSHVGRRQQVETRNGMLTRAASWAGHEGVDHLIIEASDESTVGRDKATLLNAFRNAGGVPFRYDWRTKAEPLLWIADALAGAVGEHVVGKDDRWYERLTSAGVLSLRQHP